MTEQSVQKFKLQIIPRAIYFMFACFAIILAPMGLVMLLADPKQFWSKAAILPLVAIIYGVTKLFLTANNSSWLELQNNKLLFYSKDHPSWEVPVNELTGYRRQVLKNGDRGITLLKNTIEFHIPFTLVNEKNLINVLNNINPHCTEVTSLDSNNKTAEFSGKRMVKMLFVGLLILIGIIWWAIWSENQFNQ